MGRPKRIQATGLLVGQFYWVKVAPGFNERGHNKEPYWSPVQYLGDDPDYGPSFRCMDTRFPLTETDYVEIGDIIRRPVD